MAALLVLSGLAACEPDAGQPVQERDAAPAATPAPATTPVETTQITPGAATAQQQTLTIRITADGMTITPTTARPGSVSVEVTNNASVPFDLDIDGPGRDVEFENLQPNETRTVTMTLQAGTYEIEGDSDQTPETEFTRTLTVGG